jgi:hypothetical protein
MRNLSNKSARFLFVLAICVFTGLAVSCKGNVAKPSDDIVFRGIRVTDVNGRVYENDLTDWLLDENWNDKENSLFVEKMTNLCNTENIDYKVVTYPNPCNGIFNLYISKPIESRIAFRIVDRNYNVLFSQDLVFTNGTAINVYGFNIEDDTVRI